MAVRTSLSMIPSSDSELRDSWIADTGSDTHICNDLGCFQKLEHCTDGSTLKFGDRETAILGFGSVIVYGNQRGRQITLTLTNVAYIPSLHTNIVSMQIAAKFSIYYNDRLHCLEDKQERLICNLHSLLSQSIIEYNPRKNEQSLHSTLNSFSIKKSEQTPHSTADAELWHACLAHASTAAVDHLTAATEGVSLPPCKHTNISARCEICNLVKA